MRVRVHLSWGRWVRSPGVLTGYGPGRRIGWDRIMTDVHHLHVLECVKVLAVPNHLIIKVCDGDIEVLNIGAHNLAWSAVWISEAFVPTLQPVLLDGVPRRGGEVMLHGALQASHRGKHVTVFGNVPNTFAGGTLDVRQIGTAIPVRTGGVHVVGGDGRGQARDGDGSGHYHIVHCPG